MVADLSARLTAAVSAGDFETASPLISEYRASIDVRLNAAASDQERQAIVSEAKRSLEHSVRLARIARSHLCAHLFAITASSAYGTQSPAAHKWNLEG